MSYIVIIPGAGIDRIMCPRKTIGLVIFFSILLVTVIAGCTESKPEPKFKAGDVITSCPNISAYSCYGFYVIHYHPPTDQYRLRPVDRCISPGNSTWEYRGCVFGVHYLEIDKDGYRVIDHVLPINIIGPEVTIP
jgi:hypothetical protein